MFAAFRPPPPPPPPARPLPSFMMDAPSYIPDSYTASRPRPSPIAVTLTSVTTPTDKRQVHIDNGDSVIVGRASKSEAKNLQAAYDNFLFDCPVISRSHAEIKADVDAARDSQITITDKRSMHGTSVNGERLKPETPRTLRSGDRIKFGDKVTRGHDTHDGVIVTFGRPDSLINTSDGSESSPVSRKGYCYPSEYSDDSDHPSDIESISDAGEPSSSLNTTPEQAKFKLGSQQQPIDLELNSGPPCSIINIDDDNDDLAMSNGGDPIGSNAKTVIQDTYDDFSDAEGVVNPITNLSQTSDKHDDEDAEDDDDSNDEDEHEYGSDCGSIEGIDNLSDSDASDLSNHYDPSADASDDEGPEELSSKKQPSPELGTRYSPHSATPSSAVPVEPYSQHAHRNTKAVVEAPHKPRYDPVRGSNPPIPSSINASQSTSQVKPTSTYTYGSPFYRPYGADAGTDYYGSSRWDVGPGAPPIAAPEIPMMLRPVEHQAGLTQYRLDDSIFGGTYPPFGDSRSPPSTLEGFRKFQTPSIDSNQPHSFSYGSNAAWADKPFPEKAPSFLDPMADSADITMSPPSASAAKTQMSIPNLVDDADQQMAEAKKMVEQAQRNAEQMLSYCPSSSKRKADDISTNDAVNAQSVADDVSPDQLIELYNTINTAQNAGDQARPATAADMSADEERAPKRSKTNNDTKNSKKRSRLWQMTKYSAAVVAGGAGTFAFLVSPLADRLQDWANTA